MNKTNIVQQLDEEIKRLQQVRDLLSEASDGAGIKTGVVNGRRKRRHMSAESRARIAAAQKKRWAAYKAQNHASAASKLGKKK